MTKARPVAASAMLVLGLTVVPSIEPAWPRLIMAHDGLVDGRVLFDESAAIGAIMDSDEPFEGEVGLRPSARLTFFWALGPVAGVVYFDWMDKPRGDLVPEDAEPLRSLGGVPFHGRFYPACESLPAVIVTSLQGFDESLRPVEVVRAWIVSDRALSILEGEGIPVRVACQG